MLDTPLLKALQAAGLKDKEADVYLALLDIGEGAITEIATAAGLKRAIVYHIVERLMHAGFVSEIPGAKVKRFIASDPGKILYSLKNAAEEFSFMLPVLRSLTHKKGKKPRIEYFEGVEGILSVYRSFDYAKEARFLTSTKRLRTFIPDEVDAWLRRYKQRLTKTQTKHLLVDAAEDHTWGEQVAKHNQYVRFLPKNIEMEMDFSIADSKLGITSFDPLFIVVIHSEGIAKSAAQLFDLVWETRR